MLENIFKIFNSWYSDELNEVLILGLQISLESKKLCDINIFVQSKVQ